MMTLSALLAHVHTTIAPAIGQGRVADYIPALARVDPQRFGIAIATPSGETAAIGDADMAFSIQSISKVLTLTLALETSGDAVWNRVGCEPSGTAFNSIVQLEREQGRPRNPFLNAGALAVTDLLVTGASAEPAIATIEAFARHLTQSPDVHIDRDVAASEAQTGHRNASLAHFMKSFGILTGSVATTLGVYVHQCALAMSCRQLARAGLYLAHGGVDPVSGQRICSAQNARRILALMLTCGHYDASGDVAFHVGLPAKSGVGGGILAIAPGRASIAVWSPGLTPAGNSLAGTLALEHLAQETGWSIFG